MKLWKPLAINPLGAQAGKRLKGTDNTLTILVNQRLTQILPSIAYIYEILHSNHFIILSNAIAYDTTTINRCPIFSGIAENDEVAAVEDFIDVGNILGKSWVGLYEAC